MQVSFQASSVPPCERYRMWWTWRAGSEQPGTSQLPPLRRRTSCRTFERGFPRCFDHSATKWSAMTASASPLSIARPSLLDHSRAERIAATIVRATSFGAQRRRMPSARFRLSSRAVASRSACCQVVPTALAMSSATVSGVASWATRRAFE
jgi:hypothetical protein